MSGDINSNEPTQPTELEVLKQQAAMMGITHSNNITVETLRKKIEDKMNDVSEAPAAEQANPLATPAPTPEAPAKVTEAPVRQLTLAEHLKAEAMKLVRIRISCMDPKKADLGGEIFTVANEYIGTVKKHVPFGEQTDNGYHVPQCILDLLRTREFLHVATSTVDGQIKVKTRWIKEFNIEVLPDLTRAELANLAADQRATGRLDLADD